MNFKKLKATGLAILMMISMGLAKLPVVKAENNDGIAGDTLEKQNFESFKNTIKNVLPEEEFRDVADKDMEFLLKTINRDFLHEDPNLRESNAKASNLLNQFIFHYVMGDLNTGDRKKNLGFPLSVHITNPIDKALIKTVEDYILAISNKPMNQNNAEELANTYYDIVEHERKLSQIEDGAVIEAIKVIMGATTILAYLPNDFLFEDRILDEVNIKSGYRIVEFDESVKRDRSIMFHPNGNTDNSYSIVSEYTGGLELKQYPEIMEGPLSDVPKSYTAQEINQIIDDRKLDREMSGEYGFAITLKTLNQRAKNEIETLVLSDLPRVRTLGN